MRLCLASLHPRILSGQIDSLAGLGRALVRRGHQVTLVAPCDVDGLLDRSLISLDSGPHGLSSAALRMLQTIPNVVGASRQVDVVHLALPTPAFSWVADVVQFATRTPVLVSYEGHLASAGFIFQRERLRRSWRTYLPLWGINNGFFARMSTFRGAAYVVSSDYQRAELHALGVRPQTVGVVPNVIEGSKLQFDTLDEARAQLGLPPTQRIVGYMGHFNDVKGVDLLASAFCDVARSHPDAVLALAWSGQGNPEPIRRTLEEQTHRVVWLGKVHVGRFLSAIDVLALPYRSTAGQGAYPSLVLEALHAGCPLATSRLPMLEEIVEHGRTGLLSDPERADLLAGNLCTLLDDDLARRAMSSAQKTDARSRFQPDLLAAKYESLYASLVPDARVAAGAAA